MMTIPTGKVELAFPRWFLTPSHTKDDSGSSGGTLQGRITCKDPAAQTFPPPVKRCITSRFRGGLVVSFDLSQIELRVAAILSGEPALLLEYQKPKPDLHTRRAIEIYGPGVINDPHYRSGDMRSDPRQWGKTHNFEDLFRAGWRRMQRTMLAQSGRYLSSGFFQSIESNRPFVRPVLWEWQESLLHYCDEHGRYELPFTGQSRYFAGGSSEHMNEIVNFPIQTTAGNILLQIQAALSSLLPSLLDPHPWVLMFLNIYDACYFDLRSRSLLPRLTSCIQSAVSHVENSGYFAAICSLYGRRVPLSYELHTH